MSKLLGIAGRSGSGKSTSYRNLPPKETFIITPTKMDELNPHDYYKSSEGKQGNLLVTKDVKKVSRLLTKIATDPKYAHIKYVVTEDMTHFFNGMTLSKNFRARNKGNEAFARWADFGADIYQGLFANTDLRDDLWLITSYHVEEFMTPDGPKLKIKTPGTLLEREVDIPSYYTNFLFTKVIPVDVSDPQPARDRYKFVTNDDGYAPAKTKFGAFEDLYIENDTMAVINRLEELNAPRKNKEETNKQ